MKKPATKQAKKSAPKKQNRRRRGNKTKNVREYASMSCVRSLTFINSNTLYFFNAIQLSDFTRAVTVASAYQKYRMSGVTLTIKPNQDSYTTVAAGAPQKPNLYYMIDKSGSIPTAVTLEALKQMGAKPFALDEHPFPITWKPAVLTADQNSAGTVSASQYKVSPWLSTNANPTGGAWTPSAIDHQGIKIYIEQTGATTAYNLEIEVQFEFCKPLLPALGAIAGTPLQYATLDASPDGVEGGSDGISIPFGVTGPMGY